MQKVVGAWGWRVYSLFMANPTTAPADLQSSVRDLVEGSVVSLDIGKRLLRTVRVTSVDSAANRFSAYTTSGKVRPGHMSGGLLSVEHGTVWFQATPLQNPVRVISMKSNGLAN